MKQKGAMPPYLKMGTKVKTLNVRGKLYQIFESNRNNKKYMVIVNGKPIHFGAKGYTMYPGTKRGDNYCTRSLGIKGADNINSANFWARKLWRCKGKISLRR